MKMVRNLFLILALIASTFVFAAGIPEVKNTDSITMGRGANGDDKTFTFNIGDGASNPQILIDDVTKLFEFNLGLSVTGNGGFSGNVSGVDGNFSGVLDIGGNSSTLGDGTNSNKQFLFDIGAGGSNPYIGWDSVSNALIFNNGLSEKKFGTGSGGGAGGINLLVNSSFEDAGTPILNWVSSGGTFTQENHVNSRENNEKFARFVATGAGQFFESDAVTISDDIGPGCMADFQYMQGDGAFEYKVLKSPYSDPADVISSGTISDLTDFTKAPTITFPCSGGDQLKFRVTSTGAGTIDADEVYLGSNKGFIPGEKQIACSAVFSSPTTPVKDSETGDCSVIGSRTGVGLYRFQYSGLSVRPYVNLMIPRGGGNSAFCSIDNNLTYSNTEVNFRCAEASNAAFDPPGYLVFKLEKQGVDSKESLTAYAPEQASFFVNANIGGQTISVGSSLGTPIELTQTTLDMVLNHGSAKIPCSGTNPATGLTCAAGNESLGIVFNAPLSGKYKICTTMPTNMNAGSIRQAIVANASTTILQQGAAQGYQNIGSAISKTICDIFEINSVGEKTMKLFYEGDSGVFDIDRSASYSDRDMNITVELVSHNVSRPIINNMVSTKDPKGSKIQSCKVNNPSGTPTVDTENDNCLSWIDSLSLESTGRVDVNVLTGVFSKKPTCTITHSVGSTSNLDCSEDTGSTVSTIETYCRDNSNNPTNDNFNIICVGE